MLQEMYGVDNDRKHCRINAGGVFGRHRSDLGCAPDPVVVSRADAHEDRNQ